MNAGRSINDRVIFRLFVGVFVGCVVGVVVGILATYVSSYVYWMRAQNIQPALYGNEPLGSLVQGDLLLTGLPFGILTGFIVGFLNALLKRNSARPAVWGAVSLLAAVLALWSSGFRANDPFGFVFELGFIAAFLGLSTSWVTHWFSLLESPEEQGERNRRLLVAGMTTAFCLLLSSAYAYFRLLLYLQSIPS